MTCLFIALDVYSSIGGMQRFNQRLLAALSELRKSGEIRCKVIALWDEGKHAGKAASGIEFEACRSNKLRAALKFCWFVARCKPEVILYGHLLTSPLSFAARLLSPSSRNVLIVHGWEVWDEPFRRKVPLWQRIVVRFGIDQIISVSRLTASRMRKAYELPEKKFAFLFNAVDGPLSDAPPRRPKNCAPQILTVSRLGAGTWHKGCCQVIRALPAVIERFPNCMYHIVGDGELRPKLEALAEQTGVRSHVRFHGWVDEAALEALFQSADVFALPSKKEGFGIVYLEAWKHGIPVIAGNQDAGPEVVTHGYNGLCVNPDSTLEIGAALIELLSDPDRAEAMGRAGLRTLEEKYTHDRFRARVAEILAGSASSLAGALEAHRT